MASAHELTAISNEFPAFSLNEDILLFDRWDAKYLFLVNDLHKILSRLKGYYHILSINGNKFSHYQTTYCDTPDYALYKAHHNGKLNRYKVRIRNYTESKTAYLEVKFKTNKRRTIKWRILTNNSGNFSQADYQFLDGTIPCNPRKLFPALMTQYVRLTLINFQHLERVTIDYNLEFRHIRNGNTTTLPKVGIIEVKKEKGNNHTLLAKLLGKNWVHYQRVSKYCLGMSLLDKAIKTNRYKPKLRFIYRMQNQCYDASTA